VRKSFGFGPYSRQFALKLACIASLTALAASACSSSDKPSSTAASTSTTRATQPPAQAARVVVRGDATLDGAPVTSKFVGAVVLDHGLVTPCQVTLPPVQNGKYSVGLYAATESAGCGAPGTRVALWVFAHNRYIYSTNTVAWPDAAGPVSLDATYSTATPRGATPAVAQFQGGAFAADGRALPAGTRVEAFVGPTRCGLASVRTTQDFTGYIISVVGPDAIPGCTLGAPIAFRLNGKPAMPAGIMNTPPGLHRTLDLKVA
jgi:hypothetical protein